MKVSEKEIYNYLIKKGVPHNHAIGMINNIKSESNFNVGAEGDAMILDPTGKLKNKEKLVFQKSDGSWYYSKYHPTKAREKVPTDLWKGITTKSGGLFQHYGDRFAAMKKSAGSDWKTDWKGQIDYALTEEDTKKYLKQKFDTPEKASTWFTVKWERPQNAVDSARTRLVNIPTIIENIGDDVVVDNSNKKEVKDNNVAGGAPLENVSDYQARGYYTFFGTVGSIVFGILTAQMVNQKFYGRTFMRSVLLFPYVAPVVALAYTWELLLDPNSGTLNSLLINFQIIENPINLLGQKYITFNFFGFDLKLRLALTTVIFFEIWRYFPLAFLFILARLQAVPKELYESADVDGAGPIQKFTNITLPQITAVISILFMIRFIWNFNKFEDVFLLTGGASGTRTLPINVYQQGFAISDIGMGSAVSIVIVILLLIFMYFYFQLIGKKANEN